MEYRRLGKSGLRLSALSYGSWVSFGNQMDEHKARECMVLAYEHGVNFFDNAEIYADGESERLMGKILKHTGWGRDTYCVSSKVFWGGEKPTQLGLHRKHVVDACHAALRRLQVDYLDLYFCHRPDIDTPIEETVWTMHNLVQQGKILYWGTSEWNAQQLTEAYAVAARHHLVPPTMEQPEYNLFKRERVEADLAPLYRDYGLGTTTWSPLASGVLTGKYNDGIPQDSRFNVAGYEWLKKRYSTPDGQQRIEKVRQLTAFARDLGTTPSLISLAWCLKNPNVSTVILGASRASQLADNLKALDVLPLLTDEVIARIETIFQNKPEGPEDYK